jgi:hypothetical protein
MVRKRMGPGAAMASRGPASSSMRRISGIRQLVFRISMARGLCALDPALAIKLSAAQRGVISCLASPCAVTLPSKVACLSRWRHAPLQEWADGHCPHSCLPSGACRSAIPARLEAGASQTSTGAAHANAAPDISRCQVEGAAGSRAIHCLLCIWFPFAYSRCRRPSAATTLAGFLMRSTSMSMRSVPQNSSSLNTMVGTPNTPRSSASSMMRSCSARASPCR